MQTYLFEDGASAMKLREDDERLFLGGLQQIYLGLDDIRKALTHYDERTIELEQNLFFKAISGIFDLKVHLDLVAHNTNGQQPPS